MYLRVKTEIFSKNINHFNAKQNFFSFFVLTTFSDKNIMVVPYEMVHMVILILILIMDML
tara:strand:+ start:2136 stop:2315 length:180 start_codon:yes stop_codon:yes gene_type:complete